MRGTKEYRGRYTGRKAAENCVAQNGAASSCVNGDAHHSRFSVVRGETRQEIYCEMTLSGKLLCTAAGYTEETVVFAVLGIHAAQAPVLVLLFLGLLFSILTGAAMIGFCEIFYMHMQEKKGEAGRNVRHSSERKYFAEHKQVA